MKKNILLLLVVSLLYSCNDDNSIEKQSDPVLITVKSSFCTEANPHHEMPDVKSVVYIYYKIEPSDMISSSYHYEGGGRFVSATNVIEPSQIDTIDATGLAIIEPKYVDRSVTVAFESNYYKGRFSILSTYIDLREAVSCQIINNP